MKINFRGLNTAFKKLIPSTKNSATNKAEKELFCHQYWKEMTDKGIVKQTMAKSVSLHEYLNGINHHLIKSPYPKQMDEELINLTITPRQMITKSDIEFKNLKPLKNNLTVFRCIGEKPDFFSEYKLYQKRLNIKRNEIIDMKEYAYATSDLQYARCYLPNDKGIIYQIEIPKGAKVSIKGFGMNNEILFPRSSKFKCTGTEHIKNKTEDYLKVNLEYILPDT